MNPTPYSAFPVNSFKQRLREQQRLIGCWCSLANPITTEVLGLAGFDWLLLDAEHSPNDVLTLIPQLMALKDSASAPVVRPPANEPVIIKRLLDAGFHNFLIPFVETAQAARDAVAATRYPPQGIRGVAMVQRNNRYGSVPDYFRIANDNMTVLVQIESRAGIDAVAQIAAVDGVDGVFVGPSDLAAALGHIGNPGHPEVQAAIIRLFAAIRAQGKPIGILTPVEADARRYLEQGASFVAVGNDIGLFRAQTQALADRFLA
ncbi:2-dehydro-3-deoxyglucarate aldolase [Caenimonas terrae]|uniref:2-dehydro-3-deoxyglucarate aldolase n=1 Tax=Caenimonas terrae TaxID=696074 RepID=A0ABW0NB46_9BURK